MTEKSVVDVAVLQFRADPGDVTGNVDRLAALLEEHGADADLVVAPELAVTGYDLPLLRREGHKLAERVDGPNMRRLAEACRDLRTTFVVGFLELAEGQLYDSCATIGPDGVSVYRKTHLYPDETDVFAAGSTLDVVSTPGARIGPLICFEHAFPEVATTLALAGADILVIPSCVPRGYEYLLTLRSRARAQDNQVFAVACNMTGHGFCGHSLVSDPRGNLLAESGEEETVLRCRLDLELIRRERQQEPSLRHRRPNLYLQPEDVDDPQTR